jgi:hypothetical protein
MSSKLHCAERDDETGEDSDGSSLHVSHSLSACPSVCD